MTDKITHRCIHCYASVCKTNVTQWFTWVVFSWLVFVFFVLLTRRNICEKDNKNRRLARCDKRTFLEWRGCLNFKNSKLTSVRHLSTCSDVPNAHAKVRTQGTVHRSETRSQHENLEWNRIFFMVPIKQFYNKVCCLVMISLYFSALLIRIHSVTALFSTQQIFALFV